MKSVDNFYFDLMKDVCVVFDFDRNLKQFFLNFIRVVCDDCLDFINNLVNYSKNNFVFYILMKLSEDIF